MSGKGRDGEDEVSTTLAGEKRRIVGTVGRGSASIKRVLTYYFSGRGGRGGESKGEGASLRQQREEGETRTSLCGLASAA